MAKTQTSPPKLVRPKAEGWVINVRFDTDDADPQALLNDIEQAVYNKRPNTGIVIGMKKDET